MRVMSSARRLVIPAALSLAVVGCSSEPALDASTDAAIDVAIDLARDVATDLTVIDRPDAQTLFDAREDREDSAREDLVAVPDVPETGVDRADAPQLMDVAEDDAFDDGIRCTDPRYDDAGNALCGFCTYPDGAALGCARCPDGGDAGKLSLC